MITSQDERALATQNKYFFDFVRPATARLCVALALTAQSFASNEAYAQAVSERTTIASGMHLQAVLDNFIQAVKSVQVTQSTADLTPHLRLERQTSSRQLNGHVPLSIETRVNASAAQHLQEAGPMLETPATSAPTPRAIPTLTTDATIAMLVWWPVAGDAITPLPLWTDDEPLRPNGSNGYLSWSRLVGINPMDVPSDTRRLAFAGRYQTLDQQLPLEQLAYQTLTDESAAYWSKDLPTQKLARMIIGRELRVGDHLALVAMHLLIGNGEQGIWGTLWWGDERSGGSLLGRTGAAAHYRFDSTMSPLYPLEADGSPNRCFNPWLEGGLIDSGEGSGRDSNCLSCHRQAARPAGDFLRVTRGFTAPPAHAITTGLLWTLALQPVSNLGLWQIERQ